MTNRGIRRRAWALFRGQYRGFLTAMAVLEGIGLIAWLPDLFFGWASDVSLVISQIILLLLTPLNPCGLASLLLTAWRHGAPETVRIFDPLRSFRRIARFWAADFVFLLPIWAFFGLIQSMIWISPNIDDLATALLALLMLAALPATAFVGLWLAIRLGLFSYAAALRPDDPPGAWLRASWRATKRNCWRTMRLYLSTAWPFLVVFAARIWLGSWLARDGVPGSGSVLVRMLPTLILRAFECFYYAYPLLTMAGLGEQLLEGADAGGAASDPGAPSGGGGEPPGAEVHR